jgi:hypothetical protein
MVIKKEKMKKLLVILMCLVPLVGVGQYMKAPTHYDAPTAAGHIIKGHIKMYLNDSLTEVVVEKKNDRWVTTFLDKEAISKKVEKILQQGKPEFTGRTNGGYRFYINVYDVSDDTKVINSLDITIDAFTQQIKLIEIKL